MASIYDLIDEGVESGNSTDTEGTADNGESKRSRRLPPYVTSDEVEIKNPGKVWDAGTRLALLVGLL